MDEGREHAIGSRITAFGAALRSSLCRHASEALTWLPGPAQQGWRLAERTGRDCIRDRIFGLAAEAALFSLISLPALLVAIVGSLGFVANALGPAGTAWLRRFLETPHSFLSDQTYQSYQDIVADVLAQQHGGVVSIGLLLSVWTGSRAVNRYLETITIAYDLDPRPPWRRRGLAIGLTVAGLIGAVALLPPLVLGPRLVDWLVSDEAAITAAKLVGILFWPVIIFAVLAALATLYHVGVPWHTPWRRDLPGAVLALVLWLAAAGGLRTYLTLSVQRSSIYGQLAVPIAIVLWLYLTALAVLLGAELNAEIEKMWPHEKPYVKPPPFVG